MECTESTPVLYSIDKSRSVLVVEYMFSGLMKAVMSFFKSLENKSGLVLTTVSGLSSTANMRKWKIDWSASIIVPDQDDGQV